MEDYKRSEKANYYADLIIYNRMSIREVAKLCDVSKSTVHKYITEYTTGLLRKMRLRRCLEDNFKFKHFKGGLATKLKYLTKNG